ncbi:hypothetical protein JOD27_003519 [Lentzea nigeriaca]|nr:hypothetical protein [Lentzea nigeriaca]
MLVVLDDAAELEQMRPLHDDEVHARSGRWRWLVRWDHRVQRVEVKLALVLGPGPN